jgi:Flp pilus assembly protein TadD
MMRVFRRQGVVTLGVLLSACAAGSPSAANTGAAPAYGAFLAARYADQQQDPATATLYYEQALAADPGNQSLAGEAFVAALLSGSPRAFSLAGDNADSALAIMLLGNQAALAGHFNAAASAFSELPPDDLGGLIRPILLAWAKAGLGDTVGGIATLTPVFGNQPFGPVYVLNAAMIADIGGDKADAAQFYAQAANQPPNLRLVQILGSWQARQGQISAASALIGQLAGANPDLAIAVPGLQAQLADRVVATPADGLAEAYLTLAGSLNQPSQALLRTTFLRFALMLRPNLAAARLLLASDQAQGDPSGKIPTPPAQLNAALATLQPIGPNDPLWAPAAVQEAGLLASLNRPAEAVALMNRLAAVSPGNPEPAQVAGDILRNNNEFAAAIQQYDKAIALVSQPAPPESWSLYFDRGICEDQSGDWKAAEPDLMTALALSPNQPYVLNYIGYSWALRGEKMAQAHDMLEQAVGLDPNDGAVIDSLGFLELQQGRNADAVSLLTKAVELAPDDAEVNAHLGNAFYAAGMRLQADYQWHRALSLKPDAKLQAEVESRLKQFGPPG